MEKRRQLLVNLLFDLDPAALLGEGNGFPAEIDVRVSATPRVVSDDDEFIYKSPALGAVTVADIPNLEPAQLGTLYQELTGQRFEDQTGDKDRRALLRGALASRLSEGAEEVKAAARVLDMRPRKKLYNYPYNGPIKPYKPGTKKAKLIELLSRPGGATFEECQQLTQWPYLLLQNNIRNLWLQLGFGLEEDPQSGRIRVIRGDA